MRGRAARDGRVHGAERVHRSRTPRCGCASTRRARWTSSPRSRPHPTSRALRLSPLTIIALARVRRRARTSRDQLEFDDAAQEVVVRRSVEPRHRRATRPRASSCPTSRAPTSSTSWAWPRRSTRSSTRRAPARRRPNDMLGTTLTITNVGPLRHRRRGADPAAGHRGDPGRRRRSRPRPWVVDGAVVVRQVVELAMTFDHRMVDGALASSVLRHVADFLEDPAPALIVG